MKFTFFALPFCVAVNAAVNDMVTTGAEPLGQVHVSGSTYYFQSADGNWSAPNCTNARYAYISEEQAGAKAMLSVALSAKATKSPVQFAGLCGDSGGSDIYIRITTIALP